VDPRSGNVAFAETQSFCKPGIPDFHTNAEAVIGGWGVMPVFFRVEKIRNAPESRPRDKENEREAAPLEAT
jgi:hypothetical protein